MSGLLGRRAAPGSDLGHFLLLPRRPLVTGHFALLQLAYEEQLDLCSVDFFL